MSLKLHKIFRSVIYATSSKANFVVSSDWKEIGSLSTWKMLGAQWVLAAYIKYYVKHVFVISI